MQIPTDTLKYQGCLEEPKLAILAHCGRGSATWEFSPYNHVFFSDHVPYFLFAFNDDEGYVQMIKAKPQLSLIQGHIWSYQVQLDTFKVTSESAKKIV